MKNAELRQLLGKVKGKLCYAVSSTGMHQAKEIFAVDAQDTLATNYNEVVLRMRFIYGLFEWANALCALLAEPEEFSKNIHRKCGVSVELL